jgi:hypothetical protein
VRRSRSRDAAGDELRERLDSLERRLDDLEDTAYAALDHGRLDDLAARIDDLALTSVQPDDLLSARLHAARLGAELARVAAELRSGIARIEADLDDHLQGSSRGSAAG